MPGTPCASSSARAGPLLPRTRRRSKRSKASAPGAGSNASSSAATSGGVSSSPSGGFSSRAASASSGASVSGEAASVDPHLAADRALQRRRPRGDAQVRVRRAGLAPPVERVALELVRELRRVHPGLAEQVDAVLLEVVQTDHSLGDLQAVPLRHHLLLDVPLGADGPRRELGRGERVGEQRGAVEMVAGEAHAAEQAIGDTTLQAEQRGRLPLGFGEQLAERAGAQQHVGVEAVGPCAPRGDPPPRSRRAARG